MAIRSARYVAKRGWIGLVLSLLVPAVGWAQDRGFVAIRVSQVRNISHDDGLCGHPDFFALVKINGGAATKTSIVDDQELAVWPDCGFTAWATVPLDQETVSVHIEVREEDDTFCLDDDTMDVHPTAGVRDLDFTVDTHCLRVSGLPNCADRPGGSNSLLHLCAQGDGSDGDGGAAELIFDVIVDRRSESPTLPLSCIPPIVSFGKDDVAVTSVNLIQVIENATKATKQRPAIARVGISNTFSVDVDTDLTITVGDGIRTRSETRAVHLTPGWQSFDAFTTALIVPRGSVNQPWICATAALDEGRTLPTVKFGNCDSYDTDTMMTCAPIVSMPPVNTVLIPYFYSTDIPLTPGKLSTVRRDTQKLLAATWPTRSVRTIASPIPVPASPLFPDPASPFSDLIVFGVLNRAVCGPLEPVFGPTKWVLEVPDGWFGDHASDVLGGGGIPAAIIGLFSDTTGITFPCVPFAALSSYGKQTTATHELGHLYGLSRGSCPVDLGDRILEALFCYTDCIDEYNYAPGGGGLPASGFDVRGTLYPRGSIDGGECFMGPSVSFDDGSKIWIHDGDYEWLTEKLLDSPGPRSSSPSGRHAGVSTKIVVTGVLGKEPKAGLPPAFTPNPYYTLDAATDTTHAPDLPHLSGLTQNPATARFVVRFLSSAGKALGQADAVYFPTTAEAPSPLVATADLPAFTAFIAVDDDKNKKRLHTRSVPATAPTVSFDGPAAPIKRGVTYTASWKVSGGTKGGEWWSLFIANRKDAMQGNGYFPATIQRQGASVTISTANLAPGTYNLLLIGSDGVHTIRQLATNPLTIVSQ